MRLALRLAALGSGHTHPNPRVGAVAVGKGRPVGMGAHLFVGGSHAERVMLLGREPGALRGTDLFLTLEPCVHQGRTPPCAPQVAAAGFRRAWIALADPNPRVAGRGVTALREAGLQLVRPPEWWSREAALVNAPFLAYHAWTRAWVTLKAALSLDGRVAADDGSSQWISSPVSRRRVHRWRGTCDAILVGRGTVERDRCVLTSRTGSTAGLRGGRVTRGVARGVTRGVTRGVARRLADELDGRGELAEERDWLLEKTGRHQPARIVVDSEAACARDEALLAHFKATGPGGGPWIVASTQAAARQARPALEAAGVQLLPLEAEPATRRVSLPALLGACAERGLMDILAEGGGELASSLIQQGLVDRFRLFVAPLLLGGRKTWTRALGVKSIEEGCRLVGLRARPSDGDLLVEAFSAQGDALLREQVERTRRALDDVHRHH